MSLDGWGWKPRPAWMSMDIDDSTVFGQGWQAGCRSAAGTVGEGMLRMYDFEFDAKRSLDDKEYDDGFKIGSSVCAYSLTSGMN